MEPDAGVQQHIDRRRVWENKYAIRACYRGWLERMQPHIAPGRSVEVGAGAGQLKTLWPELITTDVVHTPYVDVVADAGRLPLTCDTVSNLVVIDLLHHLPDPHAFFDEAARVLRPGGRVLAIEPYITPASWLGYRLLHHEPIDFRRYVAHQSRVFQSRDFQSRDREDREGADMQSRDPKGAEVQSDNRKGAETPRRKDEPASPLPHGRGSVPQDPWRGNLAVANLIFGRELSDWPRRHPSLRFLLRQRFSVLDFQLAGGFKPYAFVNRPRLYDLLLRLDRRLDVLGPLCGFRIFCVLEKAG